MPDSSWRPFGQRAKRTAKKSVERFSRAERPFLRFFHSHSLRVKTIAVLTRIERGEDSRRHREALCEVVMELNSSGMEYYFIRPLKLAKVSPRLEKSARLGIGGVVFFMAPVIRTVIKRMSRDELLTVCSHMRELME